MKKINILKDNRDFSRIIKNNKSFVHKNFIIYIEKNTEQVYHFGISISKKVGNAVVRNKLKRQIKSILDKKHYKKGFNCIIIVRKSILDLNYQQLEQTLFSVIEKLQIERG